jgi:hypothetical protein
VKEKGLMKLFYLFLLLFKPNSNNYEIKRIWTTVEVNVITFVQQLIANSNRVIMMTEYATAEATNWDHW